DLALGLDRVREGGVRGVAVREASTAAPVHELGQALYVALELPHQSGLPDPCRADDRHERRPALALDPAEGLLQHRELLVATDERRLHPELWTLAALLRPDAERVPDRDRLLLALQIERRQLAILDHV